MTAASQFAQWAPVLRRLGFRKQWDSRWGGVRQAAWTRSEADGRQIEVRLCESGRHSAHHSWEGCSDTVPTGWQNEQELHAAIEHERTRMDGTYSDPAAHSYAPARERLERARANCTNQHSGAEDK